MLKAAVISSAALVCGRKRLGVAKGEKNVTFWWNQEVKDAIRVKKSGLQAWLYNKAESSLHSRYAEARK